MGALKREAHQRVLSFKVLGFRKEDTRFGKT